MSVLLQFYTPLQVSPDIDSPVLVLDSACQPKDLLLWPCCECGDSVRHQHGKQSLGRTRLAVWSSPVFSRPLREPWWPRTPLPSLMYITQSRMESKIKELIFVTSVWVLRAAHDIYMLLLFAELLEFSHISSFSAWMACLRTRQSISSCSKTFINFFSHSEREQIDFWSVSCCIT